MPFYLPDNSFEDLILEAIKTRLRFRRFVILTRLRRICENSCRLSPQGYPFQPGLWWIYNDGAPIDSKFSKLNRSRIIINRTCDSLKFIVQRERKGQRLLFLFYQMFYLHNRFVKTRLKHEFHFIFRRILFARNQNERATKYIYVSNQFLFSKIC